LSIAYTLRGRRNKIRKEKERDCSPNKKAKNFQLVTLPRHGRLPDYKDLRFFMGRGVGKGARQVQGRLVKDRGGYQGIALLTISQRTKYASFPRNPKFLSIGTRIQYS
jgi:hypothetical protein